MKKSIFKRIATLLVAVMTMAICFSFSAVSAVAAEPTVAVAMVEMTDDNDGAMTIEAANMIFHKIMPMANNGNNNNNNNNNGGSISNTDADTTYQKVINFLITWLTRAGWLVAFVGVIMFALAVKNNDADQKQNGILTMIAGFLVAAVCMASDMFNLFS